MSRELGHERLIVKVWYKHNGYNICQDDVEVFIDETEPNFWEAEVKESLPFEPSDLFTDIFNEMDNRKIFGRLQEQIDYQVSTHNLTITNA